MTSPRIVLCIKTSLPHFIQFHIKILPLYPNPLPVIRDQKSECGLSEIPRGSAAFTGGTRDDGAVSGIGQEKAV